MLPNQAQNTLMNYLNSSVYASLKNYQETYEFYSSDRDIHEKRTLKVSQGVLNKDLIDKSMAA